MARIPLYIYALSIGFFCSQLPAVAVDRPELLGVSNPAPHAVRPRPVASGNAGLTPEAIDLATGMQLLPKLQRIEQLRATAPTSLELIALRQDALETLVMSGYEVRTVTARIDRELANASEILGYLAERRDRAVRLNSYADFISGGITGIVSGGMNLGKAGGLAPDLLDTIEGGLQTSLASWALQQQRGEQKKERGMPSILSHLFQTKEQARVDYPPEVWYYLTTPLPSAKNNACRLDLLVARWTKLGMCFTHKGHRTDTQARMLRVSGQAQPANSRERLTIDVLEDRIAMLNDLRATVVGMDAILLELTHVVHGLRSTNLDPAVSP